MSVKRWSIPGWLTRWFALTMGIAIVALSALSAWFVRESVERELDALVVEELHEARADFSLDSTRTGFQRVTNEYALEHPANPLAWRVWEANTEELWGEFGSEELLVLAPKTPGVLNQTIEPESGLRWRVEQLSPELVFGVLLGGAWQADLLQRLNFALLGVGALAALFAIASGAFLGRRLAGHLSDVAAQVRNVQSPSEGEVLSVDGAPEEIREVAAALGELLANIRREQDRAQLLSRGLAHELRSPIQNLMGEAEVALLRPREIDEYRRIMESQVEELRDLGRVVDNLVILCSPTGAVPRASERFNLQVEADLRLARNRSAAERAGVVIQLDTSGALELDGDREALLLALNNLVGNAIKWSPRGGVVVVAMNGHVDEIEISVDDSGPGISEVEREKVFEPFYSSPASKSSDDDRDQGRMGYGLGLALVKSAVVAHNGSIEITESKRGGARFVLRIPRQGQASG